MPNSYAAPYVKKFLDANGLAHFAQKLNQYPTNDVIEAVVDGIQDALDEKVGNDVIGAANGIAQLDSSGKVPSTQLPSYVDDVVEYSNLNNFPVSGEQGKIYVDTSTSFSYRWGGSVYVRIDDPGVMTGASSTTNGMPGLVPMPLSADSEKFLKGDGTWAEVATSSVSITEQDIDDIF